MNDAAAAAACSPISEAFIRMETTTVAAAYCRYKRGNLPEQRQASHLIVRVVVVGIRSTILERMQLCGAAQAHFKCRGTAEFWLWMQNGEQGGDGVPCRWSAAAAAASPGCHRRLVFILLIYCNGRVVVCKPITLAVQSSVKLLSCLLAAGTPVCGLLL